MIGQYLSLVGLEKHFGSVRAVTSLSLEISAGEFVSLVGPSGSGKTTALNMIAGFEGPSAGKIVIGGRDVTHVAPNRRGIGMVFQKYALFPHLTVHQNIAFPLRMRGRSNKTRIATRVEEMLELVQLSSYGERYPQQLSGGQQQRVALARALAFEPPVLLMDEPLGALDKKLREAMQFEIKRLQERLGATVVYVTHDQDEALTMSDRVAVMAGGELMQFGPPDRTLSASEFRICCRFYRSHELHRRQLPRERRWHGRGASFRRHCSLHSFTRSAKCRPHRPGKQ